MYTAGEPVFELLFTSLLLVPLCNGALCLALQGADGCSTPPVFLPHVCVLLFSPPPCSAADFSSWAQTQALLITSLWPCFPKSDLTGSPFK